MGTGSIDAETSCSTSSWSTTAARPAFAPSLRKLNAYYDYLETGRFRRDYPCFPVVLVVATSNTAEARFAKAARAASVGRYARLPLLLTTVWRIYNDPANHDGLLGPIWREPDAPFDQRRRWIEDAPVAGV